MDKCNLQDVKQIVEQVTESETRSMDIVCSILTKENQTLRSPSIGRVVSILGKWSDNVTAPVEILEELEKLQQDNLLT